MADTVLVTGGSGFVAGWCIVELLRRGYNVRATLRNLDKVTAVRAAVANGGVDASCLSFVQADLLSDDGWPAALVGCAYVLHVASPMDGGHAGDPDMLVRPAREGATRVLRFALEAGVKRVVLTSSAAAANPGVRGESFTDETVWTDPALWKDDAYRLSKVLAERAAWDFMDVRGAKDRLVTLIPTAIFGPVLAKSDRGSVQVINRILTGAMKRAPRLGVCVVDVRDLAAAHVQAMIAPEAGGQRFIVTGDFLWMIEIAQTLRERLGARAANAPTQEVPDFAFRMAAFFNPQLRALLPLLGRKTRYDWAKAGRVLGFSPRPAKDTVTECAESLLAP